MSDIILINYNNLLKKTINYLLLFMSKLRIMIYYFRFVVLITLSLILSNSIAFASKKVALVIGNSEYASSPLANPANDAIDMAISLKKLGFDVIEKKNADFRSMEKAMSQFYQKLQNAEVGFFFYAGHGIQIEGNNYLIPVDSEIANPSDVRFKTIAADRILGVMKDAGNKLNIVVLDACRNNPFHSYFRSSSKGLAFMDAPDGTIVAYATSPGSVAMDGSGRNGVYTKSLLQNLDKPLTVFEMLNKTGLDVKRKTGGKQRPWINLSAMEPYQLAEDSIQKKNNNKQSVVSKNDSNNSYKIGRIDMQKTINTCKKGILFRKSYNTQKSRMESNIASQRNKSKKEMKKILEDAKVKLREYLNKELKSILNDIEVNVKNYGRKNNFTLILTKNNLSQGKPVYERSAESSAYLLKNYSPAYFLKNSVDITSNIIVLLDNQ